jgi:AraC-like DNA-binding protein
MRYLEIPPHPALRPFVECLWLLEREPASRPEAVAPDGHPELVVHFGDPVTRLEPLPGPEPSSLFFGQLDRPLRLRASGRLGVAGARLTPAGAWSLLGPESPRLVNRATPLPDLWGSASGELEARVREAASARSRLAAIESCLLDRLSVARAPDRVVDRTVEIIRSSRGTARVAALARHCALSRRQLERRFKERVGLTPKRFARITRFQNVLRLAAPRASSHSPATGPSLSGSACWGELAVACGYFDQAHLIHDFRRFTGTSPAAWFSDEPADGSGEQHALSDRFQSPSRLERLLS